MHKVRTIKIDIGQTIDFTDEIELALALLERIICVQYHKANPDRLMWPGKSIPPREENRYTGVSVMSERKDYYGSNPNNPDRVELQKKYLAEVIEKNKGKQNETN